MAAMNVETIEIRPQPGPQEAALASPADIVVYGGAAGGGKTWALLLEPLRHIDVEGFHAIIFRRTYPQITAPGGMWDESQTLYSKLGAFSRQSDLSWHFDTGATVRFAHMQHEADKNNYQGSQIALICFDELTQFTQKQFFYMLSRNRSTCGVKPYVRATCNPDADSWVKEFLAPWVDDEHPEYPYPPGKLRWFTQEGGKIVWVDEDWRDENGQAGKSLTFIPASVFDNQILLATNPEYLASLRALDYVDQMRFLHGDWKVRPEAGKVFNRGWFEIVEAAPADGERVRFWDFAATEKKRAGDDPDWTAAPRVSYHKGIFYVEDLVHEREAPAAIDRIVQNTAAQDGREVMVAWEVEGGASGKKVNRDLATMLVGYNCQGIRPDGDKVQRAKPAAAQALAGNIKLVRGAWNTVFLNELHGFPDLPHDDIVDGLSGAINALLSDVLIDIIPQAPGNLYGTRARVDSALAAPRLQPERGRYSGSRR